MAVILMTALVPTIGHQALIEFGINYVNQYIGEKLVVIISGRSHEPIATKQRVEAFRRQFKERSDYVRFVAHDDDNAPQNPNTDSEWIYWVNVIKQFNGSTPLIGSEPYCKTMVEKLCLWTTDKNWEYIPFDERRGMISVKGTKVRQNHSFDLIMNEAKPIFRRTFTIFGQESVGKTTLLNDLKFTTSHSPLYCDWSFLPEYARPYLEYKDDPTVQEGTMFNVMTGQYALQKTAQKMGGPVIIQDTDLLSTIGYWRLWNHNSANPDDFHKRTYQKIYSRFAETKSDLYFLLSPNDVAFQPDPLRYGGDQRETSMEYWETLLKEFGCRYIIVEGDHQTRINTVLNTVLEDPEVGIESFWDKVQSFQRD